MVDYQPDFFMRLIHESHTGICRAHLYNISLRHIFSVMQKQIAAYLFQRKTCPLPGLGTLSVLSSGAEADFTNKMIAAPRTVIQFEERETNVEGLVNYLATTTGADTYEVTAALEHFCDGLKKEMMEQKKVKLDYIGDIFVDGAGKIGFNPEELPAAFLQPVVAERVIHPQSEHQMLVGDRETTNTAMTEMLVPKSEAKDGWWIWAIVLGAIGLLVLLIYFTALNGTTSFGNTIKP